MLLKENNPWLGLESYSVNDAERFFGRNNDIEIVSNSIFDNFITTIYGISGAGKTSLINAGITPLLKDKKLHPVRIRLKHQSNESYCKQIIDAICASIEAEGGEVEYDSSIEIEDINENEKLWFFLHTRNFWTNDNYPLKPVLFIDQFEEIFTQNTESTKISDFFEAINAIQYMTPPPHTKSLLEEDGRGYISLKENLCRMVFIIREDFLARLEDYAYGIAALRRNRIGIKRMNGNQALDVIMKPYPDIISKEGAIRILNKVSGKEVNNSTKTLGRLSIEPSILSLFCSELYQRAVELGSDTISEEIIDETGEDIIAQFYFKCMSLIKPELIDYLETHLLTSSGFRNSVAYEDITIPKVDQETINNGLRLLAEKRIIRIEDVDEVQRVEFTHDVLCQVAKEHRNSKREESARKKLAVGMIIRLIIQITTLVLAVYFLIFHEDASKIAKVFGRPDWWLACGIFTSIFFKKKTSGKKYINIALASILSIILIRPYTIPFAPVIWSTVWFKIGLTTIGILLSAYAFSARASYSRFPLYILMAYNILLMFVYNRSQFCVTAIALPIIYPLFRLVPEDRTPYKSITDTISHFNSTFKRISWSMVLGIIITLFIISCCMALGEEKSDRTLLYLGPIASFVLSYILFSIYKISNVKKEIQETKAAYIALISGGCTLATILCQYITYGFIYMICIWTAAIIMLIREYKKHRKGIFILIPFAIALESLLLIPLSLAGYDIFRHTQYAKVIGKHTACEDLIIIRDRNGNYGVRDDMNIVIPVEYSDISYYITGTGIPYIEFRMNNKEYEKTYSFDKKTYHRYCSIGYIKQTEYDNESLPDIIFTLTTKEGEQIEWHCNEHLQDMNLCTATILEAAITKIMSSNEFNEELALDYLKILDKTNTGASDIAKTIVLKNFSRSIEGSLSSIATLDELKAAYTKTSSREIHTISDAVHISHKIMSYIDDKAFTDFIIDTLHTYEPSSDVYEQWLYYDNKAKYHLYCNQFAEAELCAYEAIRHDPGLTYAYKNLIVAKVLQEKYKEAHELLKEHGDGMHFMGALTYIFKNSDENEIIHNIAEGVSPILRYDNIYNGVYNELQSMKKCKIAIDTLSSAYKDFEYFLKQNCISPYDSAEDKGGYYLCRKYSYYCGPRDEWYSGYTFPQYKLEYQFYMKDNVEISPRFDTYAEGTDENILLIIDKSDKKRKYIDRTGDTPHMIPGAFDHAWRFSEGLAAVVTEGKAGFIDKTGRYIIDKKFAYRPDPRYPRDEYNRQECNIVDMMFKNGLSAMQDDKGKYGLIDTKGKWMSQPQYTNIEYIDCLDIWLLETEIYSEDGKTKLFGAADKQGKTILPAEHQDFILIDDCEGYWGKNGNYHMVSKYSSKVISGFYVMKSWEDYNTTWVITSPSGTSTLYDEWKVDSNW